MKDMTMTTETSTKDDSHVNRGFRLSKEDFDKLNGIKDAIRAQMGIKLSINSTLAYVINKHDRETKAGE